MNHIKDYIQPIIDSVIEHKLPEMNSYKNNNSIINTGKDLLQADRSVSQTPQLRITSPIYTSPEYENNIELNRQKERQSIFSEPENILDYNNNN